MSRGVGRTRNGMQRIVLTNLMNHRMIDLSASSTTTRCSTLNTHLLCMSGLVGNSMSFNLRNYC